MPMLIIRTDSYGCQYANVQGVRGSGQFNLGWGFNVPSQQLVDAYDSADPRENATILFCPSPDQQNMEKFFHQNQTLAIIKKYTQTLQFVIQLVANLVGGQT